MWLAGRGCTTGTGTEWGSGSFIQKSLLAVCLARRAKTGSLSCARRLDSYQGVRPIMPEVGNCRLRRAGYLNYPFSDPARPHPPPPGAGAQQAQDRRWSLSLPLSSHQPCASLPRHLHSKTANGRPLTESMRVPKLATNVLDTPACVHPPRPNSESLRKLTRCSLGDQAPRGQIAGVMLS